MLYPCRAHDFSPKKVSQASFSSFKKGHALLFPQNCLLFFLFHRTFSFLLTYFSSSPSLRPQKSPSVPGPTGPPLWGFLGPPVGRRAIFHRSSSFLRIGPSGSKPRTRRGSPYLRPYGPPVGLTPSSCIFLNVPVGKAE